MSLKKRLSKIVNSANELIKEYPVSMERREAEIAIDKLATVVSKMSGKEETVEEVKSIAAEVAAKKELINEDN